MIKSLAASLTLLMALTACTTPVERTASGDIPAARVYIKSMTEQAAGLSQISFTRAAGLLNNDMLELAINDVVLAQIAGGERLSIWLKPGSYDFSIKRVNSLGSNAGPTTDKLTLQVAQGGSYQIQISTELRGLNLQLAK
ncbi:NAD-GH domain containing protein [Herbaspirillum huttiense]|uniref:NAD-GH domain containing protein n=1 Tax=Herbaspirillum huttiense TaxID=863372 RepID=UPI002E76B145|nr:NAD-GH domain containing protein [Herbaspirillum huttiense]MEE1636246.1 NAD-GH domain containing protein [Herbaspirillum huttiense NC40101]